MANSGAMPVGDLMETLMKDPIKRALVLQLLTKEKGNLETYRRQELKNSTPLKNNRLHCESPTALQRRRALEQRNNDTTSESSSSELSEVAAEFKGPKLPFDQLLKGVRAFVEVRRDNEDRSEGIKAVMKLMGATVKDQFTNDVTHVIFKDGSFTTFEKAKLMRIHLVSVLWLDAVRRNNARVPEKNYPAFGNRVCDANVSVLCSQIQKDYEEVVKDERRRRHTLMSSKTSMSSYLTSQNIAQSDNESTEKRAESPELTSDDSNCGVVDGHSSKPSKNLDVLLQLDKSNTPRNDSSGNLESSGSKSLLSHVNRGKRKTINVISDMVLTPDIVPTSQAKSSEKVIEPTPPRENNKSKKVLQNCTLQSSTISSLRVSTESDKTKSGLGNSKDTDKTKSSLSGKENVSVTTAHTSMSSLRLSDSLDKKPSEEQTRRSRSITKPSREREQATSSVRSNSSTSSTDKKSSEEQTRRSRSITKPSRDREQATSSVRSNSSTSSTDKVTVRARRRKIMESPQPKLAKELNSTSVISLESEEENPKKTVASKSNSNTSKTSESDSFKELNQDESPKKNAKIKPSKSVQRRLLDSSESDFNSEEQSENMETSKRNRRATSIMPQTRQTPTRNRRSTSVLSTTSSFNDTNCRRSRRLSVARTNLETEAKKNDEPEFVHPRSARNAKRATSVVSSRSGGSSNEARRSVSEDRTTKQPSVISTRVEASKDPEKNKKSNEMTPSPSKKSRVDVPSSVKTRKKLYNPNEIFTFTPPEEEKERAEYQKQKSQKSQDDIFINLKDFVAPLPTKRRSRSSDNSDCFSDDSGDKELKQKTKKGKGQTQKRTVESKRKSVDDEQRELLELLERVTTVQKRHSTRLSLSQTKPKYTFSSENSESVSVSSLPISPLKRRSTLDFVSITQSQQKRKLKLDPKRTTSIVCTKLHREEVINFENAVKTLGRYFVEDKVTGKTSHLVVGESKRTINMLRAIARGCWILKHEWLLKSQEAGKWLNEEEYELIEFAPTVQQCRLQKEAFGPLYSMDIFKDCGYIYVGKSTVPKTADLKELISICKGKVTTVYRNASIVIGEFINREGTTCVTEMWVLDSIHFNRLKGFKHYLLRSQSPYV